MRKEVLIAIILGLGVGFVITFGIYRTQKALRSTPSSDQQADALKTPTTLAPTTLDQDLAIRNPESGTIIAEKNVVVTGQSEPKLPVVLFVNNTEYLSTTDESGNFSFDVPLSAGSNVLTTYVLREDGSSFTDQRTVIQGDFQDLLNENTATQSAN